MLVLTLLAMLDDNEREFTQKLYLKYKLLIAKKINDIVGDDSEIEDLINDTFLKLLKKVSTLKTLDDYRRTAYIVMTSKRVAINFIKHQDALNKYVYYGWDTDAGAKIEEDTEDFPDLADDTTIQLLVDAVQKLPEKDKNLLYFKYYLDMTDIEIAKEIGINPNSVREYLTRARRRAKALIEKEKNDANE